jgi:hypothetical protein
MDVSAGLHINAKGEVNALLIFVQQTNLVLFNHTQIIVHAKVDHSAKAVFV